MGNDDVIVPTFEGTVKPTSDERQCDIACFTTDTKSSPKKEREQLRLAARSSKKLQPSVCLFFALSWKDPLCLSLSNEYYSFYIQQC
jgi:hypothetical protein